MRETITIFICIIIFIVALQTGLIRTGLDYETVKNANVSLQETNEKLAEKLKNYKKNKPQQTEMKVEDPIYKELEKAYTDLENSVESFIENGNAEVTRLNGWPVIKLYEKGLFAKKTGSIKKEANKLLHKIAVIFNRFPDHEVAVVGYTNMGKIGNGWKAQAPTHRHLSVNQAIAVAKWLEKEGEVEQSRLLTAGYGYSRPNVNNNSATNRRKNQYIEIKLNPMDVESLEKARALLEKETLPVYSKSKTVTPKKRIKARSKPAKKTTPKEAEQVESIGEEALDSLDDMDFDAGYELPVSDE